MKINFFILKDFVTKGLYCQQSFLVDLKRFVSKVTNIQSQTLTLIFYELRQDTMFDQSVNVETWILIQFDHDQETGVVGQEPLYQIKSPSGPDLAIQVVRSGRIVMGVLVYRGPESSTILFQQNDLLQGVGEPLHFLT